MIANAGFSIGKLHNTNELQNYLNACGELE